MTVAVRHWPARWVSLRAARRNRNRASEAGAVTLFEVLVVLVILGMVAGLVAPAAFRQLGWARGAVARQSLEQIGMILDLYKLDIGTYPTTDQGLKALVEQPAGVASWNGPYIKGGRVPLDPWNRSYVYRSPSTNAADEYDLCSEGPPDSTAASAGICNH